MGSVIIFIGSLWQIHFVAYISHLGSRALGLLRQRNTERFTFKENVFDHGQEQREKSRKKLEFSCRCREEKGLFDILCRQ